MTEVPLLTLSDTSGHPPNARDGLDTVGEPDPPELQRAYTPAEGLDPEAPYGYTTDRKTGERRPRKRAGRGVRVVKAEETEPAAEALTREPDRVPGKVKVTTGGSRRERRANAPRPEPEPLAPFRAGPIAKGVNRLYRKGGRILKVWDAEIGQAFIECTRKDIDPETGEPDAEDVTVGEAWEEIAKVNPRIRRVLLKLIEGGAWGSLFMAHAPILLAILTKESVLRRLPVSRLIRAFVSSDDEDVDDSGNTVPTLGNLAAMLTPEDMEQAAAMFSQFMPGAAAAMPPEQRGYATVRESDGTVRPAMPEDLGFTMPQMNHRAPVVDDFAAGE